MVGTTNEEIRKLMEIVMQQQEIIKSLKKRLEETQQEVQDLKTNGVVVASAEACPRGSYADVARTPPTSQPSNVRTLSSMNMTPSSFASTLFCTIDTSRVEEMERNKVTAGTIRAMIGQAIREEKDQENWRCRAVTMDPKREHRIKIACRDEAEHQLVKRMAETNVTHGARVLRDDLYPIKVDSVRRTAVLDESDQIRVGAAEGFGQENETTVAKIVWLSNKEGPKAYGSMTVYLTKAADARRLLAEGFFHAGGESGYIGVSSTGSAQINATDARRLATNRSSATNLRSVGGAPKRATITAVATSPCLSASYAKALMSHLAETARNFSPPNMNNIFRMIQLNVRKQGAVHDSLMNDEEIQDAMVLAIQEPQARRVQGRLLTAPMTHHK